MGKSHGVPGRRQRTILVTFHTMSRHVVHCDIEFLCLTHFSVPARRLHFFWQSPILFQAKICNDSQSEDSENSEELEDSEEDAEEGSDGPAKQYNLAMVSVYSHAIQNHLDNSFGTLHVVEYQGKELLEVGDMKSICTVVAMVPFIITEEEKKVPAVCDHYSRCFFVGEKPFLDFTSMTGLLQQEGSTEQ
jgi:hypothetical protein